MVRRRVESKEGVAVCDEYERRRPLDTWMCMLMGSCRTVWSYALMHDDDHRCIALRWGSIFTQNDGFLCIFKAIFVITVVVSTGDDECCMAKCITLVRQKQFYDNDDDHAIAEKKLAGPLGSCLRISHWYTSRSTSTTLLEMAKMLKPLTGKQSETRVLKVVIADILSIMLHV